MAYELTDEFLNELVKNHVSGQLKVAPEHISPRVLSYMGKPSVEIYNTFCRKYFETTKKYGLEQYLVPYLMSSHPGSTLSDAIDLALYLKRENIRPEQVQDFYPTPGTASTTMYYTGIDPFNGKEVYVTKNYEEKRMQRALLQYNRPENRQLVKKAIELSHRYDAALPLLGIKMYPTGIRSKKTQNSYIKNPSSNKKLSYGRSGTRKTSGGHAAATNFSKSANGKNMSVSKKIRGKSDKK